MWNLTICIEMLQITKDTSKVIFSNKKARSIEEVSEEIKRSANKGIKRQSENIPPFRDLRDIAELFFRLVPLKE
jgi:hypothetical protein